MKRIVLGLASVALLGSALVLAPGGCRKPQAPRLYGQGRFHDITQVRIGMGPSDVERILGSNHKTIWEEGIAGIDSGNYIWEYPEGRIYFNNGGVYKAVPFK